MESTGKNNEYLIIEGPERIKQGTEFTLSLVGYNIEDLYALSFDLVYDPQLVQLVSTDEGGAVELGEMIKENEQNEMTVFGNEADNEAGTLKFFASLIFDGEGRTGSGEILSLTFKALKTGKVNFKMTDLKIQLDFSFNVLINLVDSTINPISFKSFNLADLSQWAYELQSPSNGLSTDYNNDGVVNTNDLTVLKNNYNLEKSITITP